MEPTQTVYADGREPQKLGTTAGTQLANAPVSSPMDEVLNGLDLEINILTEVVGNLIRRLQPITLDKYFLDPTLKDKSADVPAMSPHVYSVHDKINRVRLVREAIELTTRNLQV